VSCCCSVAHTTHPGGLRKRERGQGGTVSCCCSFARSASAAPSRSLSAPHAACGWRNRTSQHHSTMRRQLLP
jgi:hypothetical protein